jgi:hypothetical protein
MAGCTLYAALIWACAAPRPMEINTPQGKAENYPPAIEADAARRQEAEETWRLLLSEFGLPDARLEFEPVLFTPRALPLELAGRINLNSKGGAWGEAEAKESLRRFIYRWRTLLGGDHRNEAAYLKDLSLVSFTDEGTLYRAVYQQMSFPFPLVNGYGELRCVLSKQGALLQLGSRLVPAVELPSRATIEPQAIIDKFIGREFSYTSIAGQVMRYRVARREEITVKDPVVYPKLEKDRLTFHLAYPVEAGRGLSWTVYVDGMTGQEIEVKQNFAT